MADRRPLSWFGPLCALTLALLAVAAWLFVLGYGGSGAQRQRDTAVALTQGGNPDKGHALIVAYGCAACHEIPGVPVAEGHIGPSLSDFKERQTIAGIMPNTAPNLMRWLQNPPALDPKTGMPNLGVSPQQSRDIAAYLYTLDK